MRHHLAGFILYTASMFAAVSCIRHAPANRDRNTSLVAETEAYLGIVPDTATAVTHVFRIANRTADTLRIDRIEPDCECVEAEAEDGVLLPGDSTGVRMTVHLEEDYLHIEKKARLYLTPIPEPIDICIKAIRPMPAHLLDRVYPVRISDNIRITTTEVCLRDSNCHTIAIANTSDQAICLECAGEEPTEGIQIYLPDKLEGGDQSTIVIYKDEGYKPSHTDIFVKLHSSDGGKAVINVRL